MKRMQTRRATGLLGAAASRERDFSFQSTPRYTMDEIHVRAETITPVLKEILEFRPPPRWAING